MAAPWAWTLDQEMLDSGMRFREISAQKHKKICAIYSGYREKLECEAGFNLEVQSQLELSFSPAAAQIILMNVCFVDIVDSLLKLD